jgi:hypothetical protein
MLLDNNAFFVREQVAVLRFADAYDLLHPVSGQSLGLAQEKPKLKWLRLLVKKQMLPTEIVVTEADQQTVALRLEKGWSFFTSQLTIFDAQGRKLGSLRNKLFSLSGKILLEDADERPLGEFSGGIFSWTRQFKDPAGVVIGNLLINGRCLHKKKPPRQQQRHHSHKHQCHHRHQHRIIIMHRFQ